MTNNDELDLDLVLHTLETLNKMKELSIDEKKKHWKILKYQEDIINKKLNEEKPPANVEVYLKNLQKQGKKAYSFQKYNKTHVKFNYEPL